MRYLASLLIALVAACAVPAQQARVEGGAGGLVARGQGVVVIGFSPIGLSGECRIGFGRAGTGNLSREVRTGWNDRGDATLFGSEVFEAGAWDLYQFGCGGEVIDRPRDGRGYSNQGTEFDAMARFRLRPGEVLYLGDIVIEQDELFSGVSGASDPDAARRVLVGIDPGLAPTMVTRQLFASR